MDSVKPANVQVNDMKKNAEGAADLSVTRDETIDEGRVRKKIWKVMHRARKCHSKCGTDKECHNKCPKPWKRFVKTCEEFSTVKLCHDKCASTAKRAVCEESCPKFANPWLARKLAGFPDKKVAWMEEKCKIMQESVACHKACAPGDFQCHHKCPKVMKCPRWHRKEDGGHGKGEFHHGHHHHHHDWWSHGKGEDKHQHNEHGDAEHHTPHGGWHHHDEHVEHRHSSHGWHEHGESGWHHHDDDGHDDAVDEHMEFEVFFEIKEVQENPTPKVEVFQV